LLKTIIKLMKLLDSNSNEIRLMTNHLGESFTMTKFLVIRPPFHEN